MRTGLLNTFDLGNFKWGRIILLGSFVLPMGVVAALLLLLITISNGTLAAMSDLVEYLPFGYAFGAGMVASVNPCGFIMLPAYIAYHIGTEEQGYFDNSGLKRFISALRLGSIATSGFIVVFVGIGGVVIGGGGWLIKLFPYIGLAIGIGMVLLGAWMLVSKRHIGLVVASRLSITPERNLRNIFLFGSAYALGSLSCTLPIFLVIVGSALASRNLVNSVIQFLSYALGMGLVIICVTIGAAVFRGAVVEWLKSTLPHFERMSILFLVGAGVYLIYYWAIHWT